MSVTVKVEGLKELDVALGFLPKSIGKSVLKRTLVKAAEPIKDAARAYAPHDTGNLQNSIEVSSRIKNTVGKAEYAAAMRGGLGIGAARQALRDARRMAGPASFAEMYVGPARGKGVIRYAHLQEFGTRKMPAHPYMRPAWDGNKDRALAIIKAELGNQIIAAAKRVGRGKRYTNEIKSSASIAALLAHEAAD